MELVAAILMIVGGIAIAVVVLVALAIAKREGGGNVRVAAAAGAERDRIAASILFQILLLGGTSTDEAFREVRRRAGLAAPVTAGIDVANWGETFASIATTAQREWLLETSVQLVAGKMTPVPLRQYSALLDLNFALGFHTDALARLRERYGFEYIDHARNGRPREADRTGGAAPLFERDSREERELLHVLGIEGKVTRQTIISTYRRLAAQHHPDKFHGQAADVQSDAAARFIEITRAYEALMVIHAQDQ
jgi:hypothetical protein